MNLPMPTPKTAATGWFAIDAQAGASDRRCTDDDRIGGAPR
jgi:hypothetical protein